MTSYAWMRLELEKMCPKDKRLFVRLKKLKTVYG